MMKMSDLTPVITAYLKPVCGWSNGVRAVLGKYELVYEDKDIINNPEIYQEMVTKSLSLIHISEPTRPY